MTEVFDNLKPDASNGAHYRSRSDVARLQYHAELFTRAAHALGLLIHHASQQTPILPKTCVDASQLAREMVSRPLAPLNVTGTDISQLRVYAGMALLQLVLQIRTGCAASTVDVVAASRIADELLASANELRAEAVGLELAQSPPFFEGQEASDDGI